MDDQVPLCVFESFVAREQATFLHEVKKQTLRADSSVVFGAFGPWCINEACDDRPSLQCRADLEEKTIVSCAHVLLRRPQGRHHLHR